VSYVAIATGRRELWLRSLKAAQLHGKVLRLGLQDVGYAVVATRCRELRLPSFIDLCLSRLSGRLRLGLQDVGHAAIATGRRELWLRSIIVLLQRPNARVISSPAARQSTPFRRSAYACRV